MKFAIALSLTLSGMATAGPECIIDSETPTNRGLVDLLSGEVKGFSPGPVYVTVTNAGKQFTTVIARDTNRWAVLYANTSTETSVSCWQGWPGQRSISVPGKR